MEIPPWCLDSRRRRKRSQTKLNNYSGIDTSSASYQQKAWRRLNKSIVFFIATLNQDNVSLIKAKLFRLNIVRGKGLLCQAIMNAQLKHTDLTDIYADLISLINFELPNIGELLLTRCILQFKKAFELDDKCLSAASVKFIAHLIKRDVATDILAFDLLKLLATSLTEHSIYLTCDIMNICGKRGVNEQNEKELLSIIFKKFDAKVCVLVYIVLKQFQNDFKVEEKIDLGLQSKQITHSLTLNSATDPQDDLNFFARDIDYEANEKIYFQLVFKKIFKNESKNCYDSYFSDGDADNEDNEEENDSDENEVALFNKEFIRKSINMIIESSFSIKECINVLKEIKMKQGQEKEFCQSFIDYCCYTEKPFKDNYGRVLQMFCQINNLLAISLEHIFVESYATSLNVFSKELLNKTKLFAYLFSTNSISWEIMVIIELNANETTLPSLCFTTFLFRELIKYMGYENFRNSIQNPALDLEFAEIFSSNNKNKTIFVNNFLKSLGLNN